MLLICITVFLSYLPEAGQYSSFFLYLRQVSAARFLAWGWAGRERSPLEGAGLAEKNLHRRALGWRRLETRRLCGTHWLTASLPRGCCSLGRDSLAVLVAQACLCSHTSEGGAPAARRLCGARRQSSCPGASVSSRPWSRGSDAPREEHRACCLFVKWILCADGCLVSFL